jgi:predicted dehydrogenase
MKQIGIVGTGGGTVGISHFHAQGLMKDARTKIAAVYDVNREAAAKWVADHGLSAKVCGSYAELLEIADAVDICTPNFTHFEFVDQAIRAGRGFLVEKPLASNIEDCRKLTAAAQGYAACNMVGYVYRYANAVQLAKAVVGEKIGKVYTLSAWFGGKRLADPGISMEWRMYRDRSGNGALGDFGSHLVDLAAFVADQRYDSVSCKAHTFIEERAGKNGIERVENDDASVFIAEGVNGIGSYTVSRTGMDEIMILITGEGGMLQISLREPISLFYWDKILGGAYTGKVKQYDVAPQKPFDGWFESEMRAFVDAIYGEKGLTADIAQAGYVEEVLHAAEVSVRTKRTEIVV